MVGTTTDDGVVLQAGHTDMRLLKTMSMNYQHYHALVLLTFACFDCLTRINKKMRFGFFMMLKTCCSLPMA